MGNEGRGNEGRDNESPPLYSYRRKKEYSIGILKQVQQLVKDINSI